MVNDGSTGKNKSVQFKSQAVSVVVRRLTSIQEANVSNPLLVNFRAIAEDNEGHQTSFVTEDIKTTASVSYHNSVHLCLRPNQYVTDQVTLQAKRVQVLSQVQPNQVKSQTISQVK